VDAASLQELFADFGPVSVRRMFGGAGVFADGLMIALVSQGVIYLKADAQTIPAFEQEGQGPFTYATKLGERMLTSYWRMPDRLYDDIDELARWGRDALAVARRAAMKPTGRSSKKVRQPSARPKRPPGRSRT